MIDRNSRPAVLAALKEAPVVFLQGARQVGKSTLVRSIAGSDHAARYLTMDDMSVLAAATKDPEGFLAGLEGNVVLDEVQRAPALALAIKAAVDRQRRPGRFLLTGSAGVLYLPELSQALVGRMEVVTLRPFSQGEISGNRESFLKRMLAARWNPMTATTSDLKTLAPRMIRGGFPEATRRAAGDRRNAWFASYVSLILQREVRDLARIEGLQDLPRLLSLLASRVGGLINHADLSRSLAIPQTTLRRYLALFEATFLIDPLHAWASNRGLRLIKSPKLFLSDTGLLLHLLGLDARAICDHPNLAGPVLENFVVTELRKQADWTADRPRLFHFRSHAGREVDIVVEDSRGRLSGIEVKTSSSVDSGTFRGLETLREAAGDRFVRGVVLYGGSESLAFSKDMYAEPIASLWA
jgi:predicted AAA+ superfamily ATPase